MKLADSYADLDIIMKLKNDDEHAMILLYRLYWKNLFITAFKVLRDKEACEDIIQDVFITIWNKRSQLNITTSIYSYLSAAVRYEVFRKVRTAKKYEPIVDEMVNLFTKSDQHSSLEHKELQQQISSVVSRLPPKCQEVYILSRNELLSHKEIASKLSISTKTVRNHLTRALHELRTGMSHFLLFLILFCFGY